MASQYEEIEAINVCIQHSIHYFLTPFTQLQCFFQSGHLQLTSEYCDGLNDGDWTALQDSFQDYSTDCSTSKTLVRELLVRDGESSANTSSSLADETAGPSVSIFIHFYSPMDFMAYSKITLIVFRKLLQQKHIFSHVLYFL